MTFRVITGSENKKRLQMLEGSLSGQPAAGGYFIFSANELDNFDNGSVPTGFNSDTLILSEGHYIVRAFLSVTRSGAGQSNSSNYRFVFEANGTLIGKEGHTGEYISTQSDCAEAVLEVDSTVNLKLKATNIQTSAPTLISDSRIFIWRVDKS